MPSISDVRRVITEFAILPLGKYRINTEKKVWEKSVKYITGYYDLNDVFLNKKGEFVETRQSDSIYLFGQ